MQTNHIGRALGILGVLTTLSLLVAGCDPATLVQKPDSLAPVLGLTSITRDGVVSLQWQASNYGESRTAFQIYRASGVLTGGAPSEIPVAFGTTPFATMTSSRPG